MGTGSRPSSAPMENGPAATFRYFSGSPSPSPATPFPPSSEQRVVLLFDWWLMKVQGDSGPKRLAVCGMTTKGQHATRIFRSAPITKRYDAYTIETADGIMVRIQGAVNKSHMHQNGFPPEVCNRFLTGFPYSWDSYAVESFVKKFTSPTNSMNAYGVELCKDFDGSSNYIIPPHTDDSLITSVLDVLKSYNGFPVDDTSTRDIVERMKKCSGNISTKTATEITKEVGSPEEAFHSEEAPDRDSTADKMTTCLNVKNDLIVENESIARVEKTGGDTRMVSPLLGDTTGSQKDRHVATYAPAGIHNVNHILDGAHCRLDDQSAANLADLGIRSVADDVVPVDENNVEHELLEDQDLGITTVADDIVPEDADFLESELFKSQNVAGETRSCVSDTLVGFKMKRWNGTEVPNISNTKTHRPLEASLGSDITKSIEKSNASFRKKRGKKLKDRIFRLDHDRADVNPAHGESRVINNFRAPTTSFSGTLEQYDADNSRLQNSEETESCHVNTVRDSIPQADSVFDRRRKTSGSESIDKKAIVDSSAPCQSLDAGMMNDFGENLNSRNSSHVTEELLPTRNGDLDLNNDNISAVVCKLKSTSRELPRRIAESSCKLQSLDKEMAFPVKPGRENVQEVSSIYGPMTRSRSMKEPKNRGKGDNAIKFSLEEVKRNKVPVPRDPTFANAVDDGKHKRKHHQDLARIEAPHAPDEMHLGDGNVSFNCSIEHAAQSDIPAQVPISKTKQSRRDSKKTRKKSTQFENQSEVSAEVPLPKEKPLCTGGRKTIWRSSYQTVLECCLTRDKAKELSLASPEVLNLKRSRSGRLLVPTLSSWCQRVVYDANGSITGISGVDMSKKSPCTAGSKTEPLRKRRKFM